MEAGMSLRDASAYNVQFRRGSPILIDSLSFELATPGAPWLAYRQFCEHFLAPLALMARVDIRLGELLRMNLEGVPLDLAARLLPGRTRFSFGLGPHIHLHARAQRQHADDAAPTNGAGGGEASAAASADAAKAGKLSPSRQKTLLESLRSTVDGLRWRPSGTEWAEYAEHTSYSETATTAKEQAVAAALQASGGSRAWDLGANTGRYSRIAAEPGLPRHRVRHRPRGRRARLPRGPRAEGRAHPAAARRPRRSEPGPRLVERRTTLAPRSRRRRRHAVPGARPPPRDRPQRPAADDRGAPRAASRRTRSSSSCRSPMR